LWKELPNRMVHRWRRPISRDKAAEGDDDSCRQKSFHAVWDVAANDSQTRIMVVNLAGTVTGFVADAVSEVLRIPAGGVACPRDGHEGARQRQGRFRRQGAGGRRRAAPLPLALP